MTWFTGGLNNFPEERGMRMDDYFFPFFLVMITVVFSLP